MSSHQIGDDRRVRCTRITSKTCDTIEVWIASITSQLLRNESQTSNGMDLILGLFCDTCRIVSFSLFHAWPRCIVVIPCHLHVWMTLVHVLGSTSNRIAWLPPLSRGGSSTFLLPRPQKKKNKKKKERKKTKPFVERVSFRVHRIRTPPPPHT